MDSRMRAKFSSSGFGFPFRHCFSEDIMVGKMVSIAISVEAPQRQPALKAHIAVRVVVGELGEEIQMLPRLKAGPGQDA